MVYESLGVAVHTHNDVLDMLVIGGVLGLIILGLVFAGIVVQIRAARSASPEFAVAVAILLVLGCQAFFTGQLFLPDIMTFYLLGITAVLACRARKSPETHWDFALRSSREIAGTSISAGDDPQAARRCLIGGTRIWAGASGSLPDP